MPVLGAVGAAAALLGWAVVLTRAVTRTAPWSRFDTLLVLIAVAGTAESATGLGLLTWPPILGHALLAAWSAVTLLVGVETAASVGAPPPDTHMLRVLAACGCLALVGLCFAGRPDGPVPDLDRQSSPAMITFWLGLGAAHVLACTFMLVEAGRLLRQLPGGPVRQAVQLVAAGLGFAVGFGLSLLLRVGEALWWESGLGGLAYEVSSISYALVAAAGLRLWFARRGRYGADIRLVQSIAPLWHQLRGVDPGLALAALPPDPARLRREELRLVCVRASIEIRDWMALVAVRLPAGAWAAALTAASATPGVEAEAAATAGWIRAGLGRDGLLDPRGRSSPVPPVGADLDDDLSKLAAVARVPEGIAARVAAAIPLPDSQFPRSEAR